MSTRNYPHTYRGITSWVRRTTQLVTPPVVTITNGDILTGFNSWTDSITSTSNPAWRSIIAAGGNATTALTAVRQGFRQDFGIASCTLVTPGVQETVTFNKGFMVPYIACDYPGSISTTDAVRQAVIGFRRQVHNAQTSFQAGTFVYELAKTVHTLRRPVQAMRDLVLSYTSKVNRHLGDRHNRKRYARDTGHSSSGRFLSDAYLEFTYGWNPLWHDARNAAQALHRVCSGRRDVLRISSYGKGPEIASYFSGKVSLANMNVGYTYVKKLFADCRMVGAVSCGVPPFGTDVLRQFGLDGTTAFVPTLWEILPWSFVIDYFTNAGALIEAASVCDFSVNWGSQAIKQRCTLGGETRLDPDDQPNPKSSYIDIGVTPVKFTGEWEFLQRGGFGTSDLDISVGDLTFNVPGVESPKKWLNMAALLRARFS